MYDHIKSILTEAIGCEVVLERPKNKEYGHFATPVAFSLAKIQKQSPQHIATELCKKLATYKEFAKVSEMKGFINLTLSYEFLLSSMDLALDSALKPRAAKQPQTILLEYVSANPTGPLHIGHARGAVLGDSLQKLGNYLGHKIVSEYYINDAGAQIKKLGYSVYLAGREIFLHEQVEYDEDCYKGEYIVEIAKAAHKALGAQVFDDTTSLPHLSEFAKDLMLEEIKQNLASAGIVFDSFVSERALFSQWQETLALLQANNGVRKEGDKLWLLSSHKGDEKDRVIVREDGEPTYLAGDIIYHRDKFMRGFEHYINIWGADHHGYIARIQASISYLGYDAKKLEVLLAQMVSLLKNGKPYKMSKRAGNFILMRDVVSDIGADSMRFVFLSKKPDTHLEFDVSNLTTQDSNNPVFYINYANARIHTLLSKSKFASKQDSVSFSLQDQDLVALQNGGDLGVIKAFELAFEAMLLPRVAQMAWEERSLQKICEYLKSLAGSFHTFYNAHKIIDSPQETLYLKVAKLTSLALSVGLSLLGIEAKTKM